MADLGTVNVTCFDVADLLRVRVAPSYKSGSIESLAPDVSGIIRGAVTELGVPVPACKVLLIYRDTGVMVAATITAADGTYQFNNLIPEALYSVVALDPAGGTVYNDQIKSSVVPGS